MELNKILQNNCQLSDVAKYDSADKKEFLANMELFLKELGEGFSFVDRQVPIKIDDETEYIDLVLYNTTISCYVLVNSKIGKFESGDVGQMNEHVGCYRHTKKRQNTVGLIICQKVNEEDKFYSLGGLEDKIFVSQYNTKLPSEEKIKKAIKGKKK